MIGNAKNGTILAMVAVCLLAACGATEEPQSGEIETVEVVPGRTTVLTTVYDEVAPRRQESSMGVLPGDFPDDLPLYQPGSLTDMGDGDRGRYVVLFSPDETTMVRQRMAIELRRTGWTLVDGSSERGTYRRGSQSIVMSILEARPGTEIRVEY